MVVGEITGRELARLLAPVRKTLGREVNSVSMTPAEYLAKARQGNSFIGDIQRGPKIFLIGGEDELGRLIGSGKAKALKRPERGD